jgi:hypothetical protein
VPTRTLRQPTFNVERDRCERWFSKEQADIRDDIRVTEEVLAFITEAGAKSVVMTDRIIAAPMKKASITRVPPVRLARSGRDGTAGPASACSRN